MRVLVVGLGGAGTRIVDRMAAARRPDTLWERLRAWLLQRFRPPALELIFLAGDAPEADPREHEGLREDEVIAIGDGAGAGGDIESADRAWRRDGGDLRDAAGERGPWDLAVVVGAAGGGTAAASMGPLVETLQSVGRDAPVVAVPVLPFEDESPRSHRNAGPALARLREADPLSILLMDNERLGDREGRISEVYEEANDAVSRRLRLLLEAMAGAGLRAVDRSHLETTLEPGNGFSVVGYAEGGPHRDPGEVVAEALSPPACSAEADPDDEANRVMLLVSGDPDELAVGALLDRAREEVPDREVLLGAKADEDAPLRVLAVLGLARSRAVETVLDRYHALRDDADEPGEDPLDEKLEEVDEAPDEEGDDEPPEWVEDYRAAQQVAKELDIKANQKHEELIEAIREEKGDA